MLELRKMNLKDIKEQWEYVTALPKDENGLTNPYEGITFEEYETTVLPELMMHENPVGMPEWFVPETYYYLWDEQVLVGEYRIRHYLTEALKVGAGHIGYSINRKFRGRGYARLEPKPSLKNRYPYHRYTLFRGSIDCDRGIGIGAY